MKIFSGVVYHKSYFKQLSKTHSENEEIRNAKMLTRFQGFVYKNMSFLLYSITIYTTDALFGARIKLAHVIGPLLQSVKVLIGCLM